MYNQDSSSATITYSDVQDGWPGEGNIDADPRFEDAANGDLHLGPGSAAIDVGKDAVCPATDMDGVLRPVGFGCDMGAYERHTFSATVSKLASDLTPAPGQVVTFTIMVTNTGPGLTGGLIADTLPAGLQFIGPITLDPPDAGSVGSAPPILAHSLVISANHLVRVTFSVSVAWGLASGVEITNTVAVTAPLLAAAETGSVALLVANVAPEANDDDFFVLENSTTSLDVLTNDSDTNGDVLSVSEVGTPDQGGLVVNGGVVITYTPALYFVGAEVFSYTISDGHGGTDTAWVTITVSNVNDPPAFTSAPPTTATQDTPYIYAITTVDPDLIHGDTLTITAPALPAWLMLVDHGDGTATLSGTPTQTDLGDHALELLITDSGGLNATQIFVITVIEKLRYYYLPITLRDAP